MKPAMGLCALLCACTPKPSEAPKPAPSAAAAMPAPQPALQGAVSAALARQEHPAAAAVLSLPGPRVLALGGQGGTDAARSALRPGSTVKPLLAYAAAEDGMLSPDHHVTCDGTYGAFHCFAKHGELGLSDALEASCNTYFYEVSEHMGLDRVRSGFSAFGLGQPTGLAPGEVAGQLPSDDQLKRVSAKQSVWPLLVGIGHGPLAVTPLQLANAYAALVDKLAQHPGEGSVYDQIRVGLRRVVAGEQGTGRAAAVDGLAIAGKTGTAQGDPNQPEDAEPMSGWFVGYAPADAPKVVVAVVVEGGGPGGKSAAPIAHDIFAAWQTAR